MEKTWMKKWGYAPFFFFSFFVLLFFLFFKSTGIHIDENEYLRFTLDNPLGDSLFTGKPPLHYATLYFVYQKVGTLLGPLSSISLYLIAIFLFSLGLRSMIKSVHQTFSSSSRNLVWFYLALLSSPLILLNMTSVMMETEVFICLTGLFSFWILGFSKNGKIKGKAWFGMASFAALAMMYKPTAIFAIFAMTVCHLYQKWLSSRVQISKKVSYLLPIGLMGGAVLGYILFIIQLKWIRVVCTADFGNLDLALRKADVMAERLARTPDYFWAWLFYLGPALGILCLNLIRRRISLLRFDPRYQAVQLFSLIALLSIPFFHLVQISSAYSFVRYGYPLLFAGLFSSFLAILLIDPKKLIPLFIYQLLISTSLIRLDLNRFALWPSAIRLEHFESSGTKLRNLPLFYLTTSLNFSKYPPCVYVNSLREDRREKTVQLLSYLLPNAKMVTEEKELGGDYCQKAPLVFHMNSHELTAALECPKIKTSQENFRNIEFANIDLLNLSYFQELPDQKALFQKSCWYY